MTEPVPEKVTRLVIFVRGERDFPLAEIKIPAHECEDLPGLLARIRQINADFTLEQLVRGAWRFGLRRMFDFTSKPGAYATIFKARPGLVSSEELNAPLLVAGEPPAKPVKS